MYQHKWISGEEIALPVGKAVCIGRNYVAHAKELNNPIPSNPLLFMKPASALCDFGPEICIDQSKGEHHYEAELVLLVGNLIDSDSAEPLRHVCGVGLGLDLTLRELQTQLKEKGHPWETAKAFDGSGCITPFLPVSEDILSTEMTYQFWQNEVLKQQGKSANMIFNLETLLKEITQFFTLYPGDIVMTGTPEGVGPLGAGDQLKLQLGAGEIFHSSVHGKAS
ncbi:fumarylacetoacetate hydrolase family protein [Pseudoalteromonas luteoviolacea]|uniref:fumarylacetoacetate hydrolase family protein n=1 Tax=Pseudoalteromonas luteoviolacea TaxID=43657 RepID=UPI001151E6D2|nr:fumarylacetoacetate hydrolase family protein [Pseudoalteromonas luteoviolacea]TQF72748.1 isomerase/hydrolase [Pseudoalteromonas luteoviolacea]